MHAETAVGDAVLELVQERDAALVVVDLDLHAAVADLRVGGKLLGEGVVVRGEVADAADVRGDVVQHGLGDGHAVVGAGPAAELVEDDEGAGGGFGENLLGFGKFDEEGGLRGEDVVIGAQARHDAIDRGETSSPGRDVTANLRHDDSNTSLRVGCQTYSMQEKKRTRKGLPF